KVEAEMEIARPVRRLRDKSGRTTQIRSECPSRRLTFCPSRRGFRTVYKGPPMAAPSRKRYLSAEQRRALELLARNPRGVNRELLVLGHHFTRPMVSGLVGTGLARTQHQVIKAGAKPVEVVRLRITDDGRRALEG